MNTIASRTILILFIPVTLFASYILLPEVDILPNPKRDTVRVSIIFEEPISMDVIEEEILQPIQNRISSKLDKDEMAVTTYGVYCYTSSCNIHFNMKDGWDYGSVVVV
ncbi:hypothetical protein ACWXWT_02230 [Shewanella sp. A22]